MSFSWLIFLLLLSVPLTSLLTYLCVVHLLILCTYNKYTHTHTYIQMSIQPNIQTHLHSGLKKIFHHLCTNTNPSIYETNMKNMRLIKYTTSNGLKQNIEKHFFFLKKTHTLWNWKPKCFIILCKDTLCVSENVSVWRHFILLRRFNSSGTPVSQQFASTGYNNNN